MWVRASHNPFDIVRLFFTQHPKLAPSTALHSLLASSKQDNSPSALFSRLFDLQFQKRAYSALLDTLALRDVCAWILDYMDRKQSAAVDASRTRKLAGVERHAPLYSHEEPIANPQAFAWGLFKSGVPERELGLVYTDEPQQPSAAPTLPSAPRSDVSDTSTDAMPAMLPQADDLVTPELPAGSQVPEDDPSSYYMRAYIAGVTATHAFLPPEPADKAQTADDVVVISRAEWEQVQHALDLAGALIACKLM